MPSRWDAATHGWSRRVFHYPLPTLMSRNFRLPCTIELQPLSLTPLKMRKVEQRFRMLNLTDDPEDHAGRPPRIFLWADVRVDNIIDPQMLNLLIKLPEHRRSLERDIRLQPVVRTMYEKSWRTRRQLIQCFGSSESP